MKPSISEQVRQRLVDAIADGKTSQYRLSREIGVAQQSIHGFIHGADSRGEVLTKIARGIGIRSLKL